MDELLKEFDKLVEYIKNSDCYLEYQKWRGVISKEDELICLIEKIKKSQKKLVNNVYYHRENVEKAKEELSNLNHQLENNPSYQNYLSSLDELNQLVYAIKYQLEMVLDKVNINLLDEL